MKSASSHGSNAFFLSVVLASSIGFVFSNSAMAGGVATVQTNDPDGDPMTVRLELYDARHLRLSSPQHPEGYLLMLGNETYNIVQFGSFPLVMNTRDMLSQLGQGQMPAATLSVNDDIRHLVSLTPTGEKETVAGIVGERYQLRYLDSAQQPHDEVVVAVKDPLIHDLSFSMYQLGSTMSGIAGVKTPEGAGRLAQELNAKGLGLLRMGTRMRLVSVERALPAADRFALPAEPMSSGSLLGGDQ